MRSISLNHTIPRVNHKKTPRLSGVSRRIAVCAKLRLVRKANMTNVVAAKGFTDIFGWITALIVAGWRLSVGGLSIVASWLFGVISLLVRPLGRLVLVVAARISLPEAFLSDRLYGGQRKRGRLAPALLMFAVTASVFLTGFMDLALHVTVDGVSMGYVQSRQEVDDIIHEVEVRVAAYLGNPYSFNPNLSFRLLPNHPDQALDPGIVKCTLFTTVNEAETQYTLSVDGHIIALSHSRTTLENMLERIKTSRNYMEGAVKTEFVQDVRIEEISGSTQEMTSLVPVEALLTSNSQEVQIYTIQSGDTISKVALSYDMSISEIKMLNPNLNIDRISIGEEIQISAAVPYLSLEQTRLEEYEEVVPFDTITEYTDTMYTNESKITTVGVPGLADVTANVVYVDGRESMRDILEYIILEEPVAQVVLQGTKQIPAKAATGSFIKPSSGVFSSGFGYRKSMGDYHTGVDFAGSVGTSIWAADGGKVTFAGWKGNYGYCVFIDHGNGFTTRYAHCSKLLVSVGQKVAKGEIIARVGSTGRSTGPHVHFEILKNGTAVNPLNYIKR